MRLSLATQGHLPRIAVLCTILAAATSSAVHGQFFVTYSWINPVGGNYTTSTNWSPDCCTVLGIPDAPNEEAYFGLDGTYTVGFPSSISTNSAFVGVGNVTWDLDTSGTQRSYNLDFLTVEPIAGVMARLNVRDGRVQASSVSVRNGGRLEHLTDAIDVSDGASTVRGAGSVWINNGIRYIGQAGTGALTVTNGGTATDPFASIARFAGSSGNVTVSGVGSSWTIGNILTVGNLGTGTLEIENGAVVTAPELKVGLSAGGGQINGRGTVLVAGMGSSLSTDTLIMGTSAGGFGTITAAQGAEFAVSGNAWVRSGGRVNVEGGQFSARDLSLQGQIELVNGFVDAANVALLDQGRMDLRGGVMKTRRVDMSGGAQFNWTGGKLHAEVFTGNLVNVAGTLAPGEAAGSSSIIGNYMQQSGAKLQIEIGGTAATTQYDFVNVAGTAFLGGSLELSLINGFLPDPDDEFVILNANSLSNFFSNVANQQRLSTIDGLGSFLVHYGPTSAFHPNQVRLTDFRRTMNLSGDYNGDGLLNCTDIDSLVAAIAGGSTNLTFDLNADGLINQADVTMWPARAGAANLPGGNSYLRGDANLDGVVDGSDFGRWNANKFTTVAAWCSGDFTADGVVDGSDFGVWNAHKFTSALDTITTIPEPGGWLVAMLGLTLCLLTRNSKSDQ